MSFLRWFIVFALLSTIASARVENPVLFIGELIRGFTSGCNLSASTVGGLFCNPIPTEVSTSTAFSCGTTDAAITGLTYTPTVTGTYEVTFGTDFNSTNAGSVLTLSYFVAGTQQAISQRKSQIFSGGTLTSGNQRLVQNLDSFIAATSGQAITVHCSVSAGTMTTANAQMQIKWMHP